MWVLVQGGALIKDLLNIEVVATLNMAFCELHHNKFCSGHKQAQEECGTVRSSKHLPESILQAQNPALANPRMQRLHRKARKVARAGNKADGGAGGDVERN